MSEEIKQNVREGYGKVAKGEVSNSGGCCGSSPKSVSKTIGYTEEEMGAVPEGANLGLGCGNPTALASLKEGEVVLDLGSGAGFDCFLAANRVGKSGKVIGIDMTPEMIEKAKENAAKGGYKNVEFRLSEIENLPVPEECVDVVISNCVINLSPDKEKVFKETYRVLKAGGRIMVSDIVLNGELPEFIKKSVEAYVGCLSGAVQKDQYLKFVQEAGFRNIEIVDETPFSMKSMIHDPIVESIIKESNMPPAALEEIASESAVSIKLSARK